MTRDRIPYRDTWAEGRESRYRLLDPDPLRPPDDPEAESIRFALDAVEAHRKPAGKRGRSWKAGVFMAANLPQSAAFCGHRPCPPHFSSMET